MLYIGYLIILHGQDKKNRFLKFAFLSCPGQARPG